MAFILQTSIIKSEASEINERIVDMTNTLSDNLKKFRQQKKYTQEQVADILGVSSHTVSRWECNTTLPDITLLPEIARLYCVSIDDLFKEHSVAYDNYAQRLASVFEATHNPEDFIRADSEFKKLLKNNGLTTTDMWSYGIIHYFMMNYSMEKALYWFDKVLYQGKESDEFAYFKTRIQKMKLLSQLGKNKENIEEQKRNVENNPDDVHEYCLLISAYIYADRNKDAYELFQKSIKKFPDKWELYIHGGDVCERLKNYDEAFKYWDKAEELGTNFLDGKFSKAACYEDLGNYENAYKTWCEIAEELISKGYDVEAEMPKAQAKICFEKLNK